MPPGKTLAQTDIEHLAEWIKMGAPDPRTEAAPPPPPSAAYDWDKAKQHWAFRPIQDPQTSGRRLARVEPLPHRRLHQGQARRKGPHSAAPRREASP